MALVVTATVDQELREECPLPALVMPSLRVLSRLS